MRATRRSRLTVVAGSVLLIGALAAGVAPAAYAGGPPNSIPPKSQPAKPAKKCPWYKPWC